jgi:hypothetical protein
MRLLGTLFFVLINCAVFAQTGTIIGKVISSQGNKAIGEATIEIPRLKLLTTSGADGRFIITNVPAGSYEIMVSADGHKEETVSANVSSSTDDVGEIALTFVSVGQNEAINDAVQSNTADNSQSDDETGISSGQSVGSALNASRDAFNSASAFSWGNFFYRLRGYEQDQNVTFINGIPMNDLEEGGQLFNNWGGLNDVFRSRTVSLGAQPFEFGFGALGFNTSMDASASTHRKQTRITTSVANRSYRNRIMATHSTGLMKNGWAFSVSASRRWAVRGVQPGTDYDAWSYYAGAEKRWKQHSTNFMVVGSDINRARNSPAMLEAFAISGDKLYNRNWGYQNGQIRNARRTKQNLPILMLNDEWRLNSKTVQNIGVSYQWGTVATSGFDWFNTQNPQPDYYRNFPSYYNLTGDTAIGASLVSFLQANPNAMQIDWDAIYQGNQIRTPETVNGETGRRSSTVVSSDVEGQKRLNASYQISHLLKDNLMLYGGAYLQSQNVHAYKRLDDLLGGDYYVNVNGFNQIAFGAGSLQIQNDLQNPNRIVKVGDKYSYDYKINLLRSSVWGQAVYTGKKVDAFFAASFDNNSYQRDGAYQSGIYQNTSLGKSKKVSFTTGMLKGGATYKINGRNYLYANGAYGTRAPYYDNVFISPRTRNEISAELTHENVASVEAGYLFRSPTVRGRLSFYATDIKNAMDIKRYFDDITFSNVNMVMTGVNKRYTGIDFGADIKIDPAWSVNVAAALNQAFYTSNANLVEYRDNDTAGVDGTATGRTEETFIKNFSLSSGPTMCGTVGLNYRSPKFWFATLSLNGFARSYVDIAPNYRTRSVLDVVAETQGEAVERAMYEQRVLPSFATIDLFFGKSWRVHKFLSAAPEKSTLFLNIGMNNIANNQNIRILGFEQLRYKVDTPTLFQPKYMYQQGIQYFINLSYSF